MFPSQEMMPLDSYLLLLFASVGYCLRLMQIKVPSLIDVRDIAVMSCTFDLEGDTLNSVKWYKEELEFFRYTPKPEPRIQTFQVEGINLQDNKNNISSITLSPLEYRSSGSYRCEVSTEAPHFKLVHQQANMTVMGLPKEDPTIEGIQDFYNIGSYVIANCTSAPSKPPAKMDWLINGIKAQHWLLDYYYAETPANVLELEPRTIGLKFQTDISHFHSKGTLTLVCTATVADLTRRREKKALLSKLLNEKFAQHLSNSGVAATLQSTSSSVFFTSFRLLFLLLVFVVKILQDPIR